MTTTISNSEFSHRAPSPAAKPARANRRKRAIASFVATLTQVFETIRQLDQRLVELGERLRQLQEECRHRDQTDPAVAALAERARQLEERHHEQEVVRPVCNVLISLLDRVREQQQALQAEADKRHGTARVEMGRAYAYLANARAADVVELENGLEILGVQAYQSPRPQFDPQLQRCIGQVPARNGHAHGKIATRKRLGYRRNDTVIRPECVVLYMEDTDGGSPNTGEMG